MLIPTAVSADFLAVGAEGTRKLQVEGSADKEWLEEPHVWRLCFLLSGAGAKQLRFNQWTNRNVRSTASWWEAALKLPASRGRKRKESSSATYSSAVRNLNSNSLMKHKQTIHVELSVWSMAFLWASTRQLESLCFSQTLCFCSKARSSQSQSLVTPFHDGLLERLTALSTSRDQTSRPISQEHPRPFRNFNHPPPPKCTTLFHQHQKRPESEHAYLPIYLFMYVLLNNGKAGDASEAIPGQPCPAVPDPVPPLPRPDHGFSPGEQPVAASASRPRRETVDAVQHRRPRGLSLPPPALPPQPRPGQPARQAPFLGALGDGNPGGKRAGQGTPIVGLPEKGGHRGFPVAGVPDQQEPFAAPRGYPARGVAGVRPRVYGEPVNGARVALERRERSTALRRPHDDLGRYCGKVDRDQGEVVIGAANLIAVGQIFTTTLISSFKRENA